MGSKSSSQQQNATSVSDSRLAMEGGGVGNTGSIAGSNITLNNTATDYGLIETGFDYLNQSDAMITARNDAVLASATNIGTNILDAASDTSTLNVDLTRDVTRRATNLTGDVTSGAMDFAGRETSKAYDIADTSLSTANDVLNIGRSFANDLLTSAEEARKDSFSAGQSAVQSAYDVVANLAGKQTQTTQNYSLVVLGIMGLGLIWAVAKG